MTGASAFDDKQVYEPGTKMPPPTTIEGWHVWVDDEYDVVAHRTPVPAEYGHWEAHLVYANTSPTYAYPGIPKVPFSVLDLMHDYVEYLEACEV